MSIAQRVAVYAWQDFGNRNGRAWAFADQCSVAMTSLILSVLLARWLGLHGFGIFVIGLMTSQFVSMAQAALVSTPMSTHLPLCEGTRSKSRVIGAYFFLAVICSMCVAAIAFAACLFLGTPGLSDDTASPWAFPLFIAGMALHEWARKAYYACERGRIAFCHGLAASLGQFAALALLFHQKMLSVSLVFLALGSISVLSACIAVAVVGSVPTRAEFYASRGKVRSEGVHFVAAAGLQWFGSSGVILMAIAAMGPVAAGAIRAAQSMLGPVNVILQVVENVVPPAAASKLKSRGSAAMRLYLGNSFLVGLPCFFALGAAVALLGGNLMERLYGSEFGGFEYLLMLQALYYFVSFIFKFLGIERRVLHEAGALSTATLLWAVTSGAVLLLLPIYPSPGLPLAGAVLGQLVAIAFLLRRGSKLAFAASI